MLTPPCFVGYEVSESEWHWVLFGGGDEPLQLTSGRLEIKALSR